jgi:hypothetical protein
MFLFERGFDEFLCASIVEEKNGMALSVMSAFARRNVDPWQEAARLSQLPRDVATRELCAMIAELPGSPSRASPQAITERLMAALPRYAGSAASPRKTPPGRVTLSRRETARSAVVFVFLLVVTAFVALSLQSKSVHPVLPPPHQMPEAQNDSQRRSLAHRFPSSRAFSF